MLPLDENQQQILLRIARQALTEAVLTHRLSDLDAPPEAPDKRCGAFATLHKGKLLRGCIGHLEPVEPLYQTVRECTLAAALHDPRFEPVTPEELPELRLELSVLSPLVEISPEQVEVGRHGLMISRGAHRGLLLPQVAVQWKWDREQFLSETCRKAGLPEDAWQHGAKIQAFTAQVFAEPAGSARSSIHAA
jgi:AmmeMemoRadiSam system protein A